jgi:ubiquinone/menaquinone biosynthesis C-methylase UbiE
MVAIARERVPGADVRVGAMEALAWPDERFDVVTAINALQFAADVGGALAEAARVTCDGGLVAVSNWGPMAGRELFVVLRALARPAPDDPTRRAATDPSPRRSPSQACSRT